MSVVKVDKLFEEIEMYVDNLCSEEGLAAEPKKRLQ